MSDLAQVREGSPPLDDAFTWADFRRWTALAVAGSWFGWFLFTGMPQLTPDVFPRVLLFHALVAVVAFIYVAYLAWARRLPGGTPLDIGVLAMAGAYAVATIAAVNWRASLELTLQLGAAVIAFYALSELPVLNAALLRRAFAFTGVALAAVTLYIVGNDYANYLSFVSHVEGLHLDNIFPSTVPRAHGVSDHPNVLAMLITLIMPFFALSAYHADSRWERVGGAIGLAIGAMAIFLTLSRGGWIGVVGGVSFTLAGAWVTTRAYEREQSGGQRSWQSFVPSGVSPTAIAAIIGAALLAGGGTLAFLSRSSTRPEWLFRNSLSAREDVWRAGYHTFLDHLLTGAGPNGFGLLYPQYAHGNYLIHAQHAHNGFLQLADDAGSLGIAALLALAATVVFVLFRTWRHGSLEQRLLAVACGGALVGFSIHNQVDAGNIWKAPAFALAVVGAIIARNYRESTTNATPLRVPRLSGAQRRYTALGARGALLLLLVLPFLGWYKIDHADYDYNDGVEKMNRGEPGAIARLQAAVDADSSMMPYQLALGQAQASAFLANNQSDRSLIDNAIVHLKRAVDLDYRSDLAHANLARAYQLGGLDDDAAGEALKTRFIARFHVPAVLVAGEVYERIGRTDDAIATYAQVISMDASLADSTYWQGSAFREQHFDGILKQSFLGRDPCTEGAYLVQSHRFTSSVSLEGLDAASKGCQYNIFVVYPNDLVQRVSFAKILLEQGRLDEAFIHLDFAVKRQPDFGYARTELGRYYQLKGDLQEARHQWVVGSQLEDPESLLLLGNSYPAGQVPSELPGRLQTLLGGPGSSIQNDIVWILYYRLRFGRQSPPVAFIPGDWQTAVPRLYTEMSNAIQRWRQAA
ncbi:MAG: O-antigen ligase family protein [Chloroflexota bacterium]|nr:O-antigen ligase family protein [Chloroflexota bacterium]